MSSARNIVVQDNDVAETNVYLQLQCLPSGNWGFLEGSNAVVWGGNWSGWLAGDTNWVSWLAGGTNWGGWPAGGTNWGGWLARWTNWVGWLAGGGKLKRCESKWGFRSDKQPQPTQQRTTKRWVVVCLCGTRGEIAYGEGDASTPKGWCRCRERALLTSRSDRSRRGLKSGAFLKPRKC